MHLLPPIRGIQKAGLVHQDLLIIVVNQLYANPAPLLKSLPHGPVLHHPVLLDRRAQTTAPTLAQNLAHPNQDPLNFGAHAGYGR
jgi:hypothetical protein